MQTQGERALRLLPRPFRKPLLGGDIAKRSPAVAVFR